MNLSKCSLTVRILKKSFVYVETRRCNGGKNLSLETLNPRIIKVEYAVRGPLIQRALAITNELKGGASKPFKRVIHANLGDAHAMGQKPVTYVRQVLSCVINPELMNQVKFPEDVVKRAKILLGACGGQSVGAYSASPGIEMIRKSVAKFVEERDKHPCDWTNITLGSGASNVIKYCLEMFCNNPGSKPSGVMIPIPQYPLYSATLTSFGMAQVPYYLDEKNNWGLNLSELERALKEGEQHCQVRAIVVINPGNPTGQVLTRKNIEEIIKFAAKYKLFIFADEVYQFNIYGEGCEFFSFKKILIDLGEPYKNMELASFNSLSKGYAGECGIRGGWMELINVDKDVVLHFQKAISANLCPTILGQIGLDTITHTPKSGDPSYDTFVKEKKNILASLKQRSIMVYEAFNKMEGFQCNPVQGAMYAFPKFSLSAKALEAAKKEGKKPDVFYAFRLLEETGICIVAGSGFGQLPGTYHFRTTILAQPQLLQEMLQIFSQFHNKFTKQFA